MKFVRPLFITLGILGAIVAIGFAVVLTPAVQRWAVLRAAAKQPGLKLEAERVSAGFSSAELVNVQFEQQGLVVGIDRATIEYSLWQILFHNRLHIQSLVASGLLVDASHLSQSGVEAKAAASPVATPGILTQITLPFELVLDNCQLDGKLLLPGAAGQPPLEATYEIKGGKFAPNQEGSLLLTATVKNPATDAQVGALHAQVSLRATETSDRGFSRVNLTSVVDASGQNLSGQNQLKIVAELAKTAVGENYSLNVDTLIVGGTAENLLVFNAALPAGQTEYAGQWTLKAKKAQLEPFFLGMDLPDFDSRGEGKLTYSPLTQAVALQGNLVGTASRLEVIDPKWKVIGPVKLNAEFDVAAADGVARMRQLNVNLAGEKPILEFSGSQAAEIDFNEKRLRVGGTGGGEALNVKLLGVPLAWIAPFVPDMTITGGAITGEFSITGGSDELQLHAIRPLMIDELTVVQKGETLLSRATITLALNAVLTEKELQVKQGELALQTPLGDSIKAQGSVSIPVAPNPPIEIQAAYSADLPALLSPWLRQAHIKASGEADLTLAEGKIEVRKVRAAVTDGTGLALFNAVTLLPFTFDPATSRALAGQAPVDLVKIDVGRIPLDWLPLSQPGEIAGGTIEPATFILRVDGEKLFFRADTPFKLAGLSLKQDGQLAFSGLTVEASPALELDGSGSSLAKSGDLTVRNAAGTVLLTLKGEVSQSAADGLRANMTFNLEVPALATQPYFSGAQTVSEGRASGELRATFGPEKQVEARLTVNGLVAKGSGQVLPVANLSFRALINADGKITLQAPLLLDRAGQRSDLNFAFELTPAGRDFSLDGKLTGAHIELTDALAVLGVFSSSASKVAKTPASSATTPQIVADQVAAWSRLSGRLVLDIVSATWGKDWSMTGLTGLVVIDPKLVALQKLNASFGENSQLNAKGNLRFTAGAQPYRVEGDFSLTEFDAGKLFKAFDPSKAPTVEGLFSVNGHFTGNGETLDRTFTRTHGQFDLTSRQGIFRGLQRATSKVSMTSKAVELGASVLGSLLGSDKATKAAEKVAGQAYFVDQLAQSLSEFNYDQLSLKLVRDESLSLAMREISLISPEIRLVGEGAVTHVEGKSLLEQPMNVALSFAARGKVEQLLGKLRLVDGTHDEVGYARAKEVITLGGSLAKPDPTAFFTKIATAKIGDLLDSE